MENNQNLSVRISRDFAVPVDRLYTAWTTETDLRAWWQPMGNTLHHLTNDLKEGGSLQYEFHTKEGELAFKIEGVYREVAPNKKLVYTWNWKVPNDTIQDSEFLLTIKFHGQGSESTLQVQQENFVNEEAVLPHQQGWEKALEDLQSYLSNGR